MKTNVLLRIGCAALLVAGCSSGKTAPTVSGYQSEGADGGQLLRRAGLTGAVIRPERRFAALVPSAQRVSLIDPVSEREAFGRQIGGTYTLTSPLPDFSGAAVFGVEGMRIVTADADLAFPWDADAFGFLAIAPEAAAYAVVDKTGHSLRIVRTLPGGAWQDTTVLLPWDAIDPASASPYDAPAAVAHFSADGTKLVALRPRDGQIAVFAAPAGGAIAGPSLTCAGRTDGDGKTDLLRTAALRADGSHYVLGDYQGKLYDFTLAACPDWTAPAAATLGTAPITNIESAADGTLAVTQVSGRAHLGTLDAIAAGTDKALDTCAYPLGVLPTGAQIVVACYAVQGFDPVAFPNEVPATVPYRGLSLEIYPADGAAAARTIELDLERDGGAAVDADVGALFEVRDSAFGVLAVTSLSDGATHERKGLFLAGILD